MVSTRLDIAYDGSKFYGWARQNSGLRTVQQEIEQGLRQITGRDISLTVAGRTDSGVHARGQVASYSGEAVSLKSLNAVLPRDISINRVRELTNFDARHDAKTRTYCFRVCNNPNAPDPLRRHFEYWFRYQLDFDLLLQTAAACLGQNDFTAFTPTQTQHVFFRRTVSRAEWKVVSESQLEFWITADAFMHNMNRILVGTMLHVACGKMQIEAFYALLKGAARNQAGPTLPPHGLCLESVQY